MIRQWAPITSVLLVVVLTPRSALAQRVCPWVMQMQQQQYQLQMQQHHWHQQQIQQTHYQMQMSQMMHAQVNAHRYAPPPVVHHQPNPPGRMAHQQPGREIHIKPPAILTPRFKASLEITRHTPEWKWGHGPGHPGLVKPPHDVYKLNWAMSWTRHQPNALHLAFPGKRVEKGTPPAKQPAVAKPKGPKLLLPEITHEAKAQLTAKKTTATKTTLSSDELKLGLALIKVDFSCAKCHQHAPSQPTAVARQPAPAVPVALQAARPAPQALGQPKGPNCLRPEPALPMQAKAPAGNPPLALHKPAGDGPRMVRQPEAPKLARAVRPPNAAPGMPMPRRAVQPNRSLPVAMNQGPVVPRPPTLGGVPSTPPSALAMLLPAPDALPYALPNGGAADMPAPPPQKAIRKVQPKAALPMAADKPSTMPVTALRQSGSDLLLPDPVLRTAIRSGDGDDTPQAEPVQTPTVTPAEPPATALDGPTLPPLSRATLVLGTAPARAWDIPDED